MQWTVVKKLHNIAPKYCPFLYEQGHQKNLVAVINVFIKESCIGNSMLKRVTRCVFVSRCLYIVVCVFIVGVRNPSYNLGSVRVWHSALCRCILYTLFDYIQYYSLRVPTTDQWPVRPRTILNPHFFYQKHDLTS